MSTRNPVVWAVVPIHNGKEHTLRFLNSLKNSDNSLNVVVIDDGSTDGSSEAIKKGFPAVKILRGDGTLWWSGATNEGVKFALDQGADFIYTINNDVELSSNAVHSLLELAKSHPKALIGSKVCYKDDKNKVWFFGAYFDSATGEMMHVSGTSDQFTEVTTSDWLTGMGVLIPAEVFSEIGWYDTKNFPQYFGDADFSLRAHSSGYELLVSPEAVVYSDVESSWLSRQPNRFSLKFIRDLMFSIRSPYSLKTRYLFYKRHWNQNAVILVIRIYSTLLRNALKNPFKRGGAPS